MVSATMSVWTSDTPQALSNIVTKCCKHHKAYDVVCLTHIWSSQCKVHVVTHLPASTLFVSVGYTHSVSQRYYAALAYFWEFGFGFVTNVFWLHLTSLSIPQLGGILESRILLKLWVCSPRCIHSIHSISTVGGNPTLSCDLGVKRLESLR